MILMILPIEQLCLGAFCGVTADMFLGAMVWCGDKRFLICFRHNSLPLLLALPTT